MTATDLVRDAFRAINDGDLGRCAAFLTEDFAINLAGMSHQLRRRETSIELYRVADGKLAEEWIVSDVSSLMAQLGSDG